MPDNLLSKIPGEILGPAGYYLPAAESSTENTQLWSANIQSRRFWLVGIFMMQPAQHRFRVHHEALA